MKKIAIDCRMWGPEFTGIGNYLREISTRLFQTYSDAEFIVFLSESHTEEVRAEISSQKNVTPIFVTEKIYSWGEQTSFLKKLNAVEADIYFFPHFNVPLFFRKPFVTTIHDLTILKYPGKKMSKPWHRMAYLWVLRHALRRSEKIISVSEYTKKEILDFDAKIPHEKVEVILNGIDVKRFSEPNPQKVKKFRKQFGTPFFLISGVWREHKNIPGAIRAFEMLRKYGGEGNLVISGKEDPHYPEVKKLSESSEFAKDIILTGFIPEQDMPSLFAAADTLLFPSFAEGFGLPALEAMAAETPIVASDRTCLPEICGNAALFCNPTDPENVALKMIESLEEKIKTDLQKKGKQRIKDFSWDTSAKKTGEVILGT